MTGQTGIDNREAKISALAVAALLVGNICLAIGPWLVRAVGQTDGIGPLGAGFWRLALAIPALLVLMRSARPREPAITPLQMLGIAAVGVIFAADLASWHLGIVRTKLANAALFGNSTSLIFPVYGFIVARMAPSRAQLIALLLGFTGAVIMLGRSYEVSAENLVGDALCLLAGGLYTLYLIAIDRMRARSGPWTILTFSTIGGAPALLLFAAIAGEELWPQNWTTLFALALIAQVIGQALLIYTLGQFKPIVIGIALLVQPVVGGLIGWIGYREALGPIDLIGAACIAVAMILVLRPSSTANVAP